VQGLFVWPCAGDHARFWKVASRYALSQAEAESTLGPLPAKPSSWSAPAEHTIVEAWTADTFELWLDGDLLEENANPYGFIPFVIYPNVREPKRFWGVSDLEAVKEPLRELNRAVSQLSTILELSGNPIAVLENVTEAQDIAVQPGAVWEIPEKARAYLLTSSRAAAPASTSSTPTSSCASSMTSPRYRAAHSARRTRRSPASPSRWSSTPSSRKCSASA